MVPTVQREVQHDNNNAYERDELKTVDKNNWTILKDTSDTCLYIYLYLLDTYIYIY